ncbi:MAG: ABC transporter permease [Alphaproteobacteria bacterium]|nr:ABC transporter permease [Alphaproteobacteria bacterium]MBF0250056.1 ABC transporter permease [Alphaproteobacteria bacterium]
MTVWLRRQKRLIDYTVASLLRRAARNFALLAVYTLIVFVLATVMLFTHALRQEAMVLLDGAPEITVQRISMGRHDLIPASYVDAIADIRGARDVRGRLWGYFYDTANGANYTLMVPDGDRYGAAPDVGETVAGAGVARSRGVVPGKYLFLLSPRAKLFKLKLKDVLDADSEIVTTDLVLMAESDFRAFFDVAPDVHTDIVLKVRNPREVAKVAEKISNALPDCRVVTRGDILRTYDSVFNWREGILLALLGGAIFAFVIFAWEKASGLSAEERREIGILKAVGWETSDVIKMKMWEGAVVSLGAFLTGYVLAYIHVFYFSAGLLEPVLKGWAVLYPRFELTPQVDGVQVATLLFFTVAPYIAATLVPIWRAAITDPDAVMR